MGRTNAESFANERLTEKSRNVKEMGFAYDTAIGWDDITKTHTIILH